MKEQLELQKLLRRKFVEAQSQNPRFSLRAFAQRVEMNPGALSGILNGKRVASKKIAERVARNLLLDPQERAELLEHFPDPRPLKLEADHVDPQYLQINASQFRVIGEWEHFALLSLMNTKRFKNDPEWMARRLGIPQSKVELAIHRLIEVGMIERDARGRLKRCKSRYRTRDDVADISIKRSHEETLEMAKTSIRRHAIADRDHSAVTMAIDPKKIPAAKEKIRRFQDELAEFLESGNRSEVYRLAVQLFPLSELEKGDPHENL